MTDGGLQFWQQHQQWREEQMATVDKKIADEIASRDGYYGGGDPRVMRIVKYDNAWGGEGYGLEYAHEVGRYQPSEFVKNPIVYWEAK